MRPKNLKSPLTWKTRRPIIQDHILYVPEYYANHQDFIFPGWASQEVFGRDAPIEVEYCTGNGAWIVEKALAHPERNWVAVEIQFERVRKIWSKIHNFNLKNLFIVCGEGLTFTKHYVPAQSFHASYVNFPDPWPKPKHAKNRLLKEPFFSELSKASVPGAVLTVATDHLEYTHQITGSLVSHPLWEPILPFPHFKTDYPDYGSSYFEALWKDRGLTIQYIQYQNRA